MFNNAIRCKVTNIQDFPWCELRIKFRILQVVKQYYICKP